MTLKHFTQYGIVRLLGYSALATSMISTKIPATNLHNAIPWVIQFRDSVELAKLK